MVIIKKIKYKTILHYLFAFLIPILIFLFAMYLMDLYPFGDTSMRVIDAISQYPAFFEGLKDGDLFTFKIGLGANFYTIWTTYLASPLSLLYFLFENYQFDTFFVILVLLKIGLIGLNMNILLNYKKERNKYSLIFSTIYALSGFVSLYYWNYQFLDALYMLPLIMIGIEKLVSENKNLMYFISLTLMIIFHYYTAYMICIFSVIYFFFLLINSELEKKEKKKRIIKFFVTSLFCGLCSSFVTIPSIYSFINGRAGVTNDINYLGFNKDALSLFYNFTSGSIFPTNLGNNIAPSFVTMFIVILIIYTFFYRKLSKKYKLSVFVIFLIYILSLFFCFFYYGWHFFSEPQGLPGRFVFCFNCYFILIAYQTFLNKEHIHTKKCRYTLSFVFLILLFLSFLYRLYLDGLKFSEIESVYIILFIVNIFLVFYYIFFINCKKCLPITISFVLLELIINLTFTFNVIHSYNGKSSCIEMRNTYIKLNDIVGNINKNNDFYRLEINNHYNAGLLFDYNGINYYSSLYNKSLLNFLNNYKYSSSANYILMYKNDFYMDSFLGLKYLISENNREFLIIENESIKSLGFMVSNNYTYENNVGNWLNNFNFFTNEKYSLISDVIKPKILLENVVYNSNVYEIIDKSKDGFVTLRYNVDNNYYINEDFDLNNTYINTENNYEVLADKIINVFLNGKKINYISKLDKGDQLEIKIKIPKNLDMLMLSYDELELIKCENYDSAIKEINNNIITNIKFNNVGFVGNIIVNNNKNLLLLTIPYDENYEIYVNNKKANYSKYLDGIVGLELKNGNYTIIFKYKIKALKFGVIMTSISICIFIILKILEKKYIYVYNNSDNKEEIFI